MEESGAEVTRRAACYIVLLLISLQVTPVLAYDGGLDGSGGHANRKTGEYHYPLLTSRSSLVGYIKNMH